MITLSVLEKVMSLQAQFKISTDRKDMQLDDICNMLWRSYWADKRSKEAIEISLDNSLCIGVFDGQQQVGLTRVITDYATFAYICDVIVHEDYRGKGLGKELMKAAMEHPRLKLVTFWSLATRDAHSLYEQFGFQPTEFPNNRLEIRMKDSTEGKHNADNSKSC